MKVAIVHDYIKEYGGAERVLEVFHEIWPEAPIFTSVFLPEYAGPHRDMLKKWNVETSAFQNLPFKNKLISPMRMFSGRIFGSFDLSRFDLVLVSATGAYIPNGVNIGKNAVHICYCHTPPRYLYGYPTARNWRKTIAGRLCGDFLNHFIRMADFKAYQKPAVIIANSEETKERVRKFYRRDATVIYPPVTMVDNEISKLKSSPFAKSSEDRQNSKPKGDYFLTGGRLARAKHIELAIGAANKMGFKLKVFGKAFAGYEAEIKNLSGPSIEFTGEVDDRELKSLYRNCRAFIFPSEYEDFGIVPVEAQAFGAPVIAYRGGGVKESVIENKTGVFFDEMTVESLISAIRKSEKLKFDSRDMKENVRRFSKERFKKEIINLVNKHA